MRYHPGPHRQEWGFRLHFHHARLQQCVPFCAVPYTRGTERSRDPQTIVAEAEDVFRKGYWEVKLPAERGFLPLEARRQARSRLCRLLEQVARQPELRTGSPPEPPRHQRRGAVHHGPLRKHLPHIHLPVHREATVFWKMRRRYTRRVPGAGPQNSGDPARLRHHDGCDRGFRSETEEDHRLTLSCSGKSARLRLHVLLFGTAGHFRRAEYPDDVPLEVTHAG